jgi:hypothetical protein
MLRTERFVSQRANDTLQSWVHVDSASGQIVSVMDSSRRVYAWLYYGLHTFSFPFLTKHPILRRTIMVTLLSAGYDRARGVTAALFGASTPFSKLLLGQIDPLLLAGLLYLGSGVGMAGWIGLRGLLAKGKNSEAWLRRFC